MQKDKLKELIKQCLSSVLEEESSTGGEGYLGRMMVRKPQKESTKISEQVKFKIVDPKEKPLNEVRYTQFKKQSVTRTPQEQLHMGVKEIYRKLDEINRLVEFTSRMKNELKGDAEEMNLLKRTHNSLFKINEKIQEINNKIKSLTT